MSEGAVRAFIAIELPENVRNSLRSAIRHIRGFVTSPDIKWVPPENIHLTLKFLGQVPLERVEDLRRPLKDICTVTPPMTLEVCTLGGFPSPESPRVVWVGLSGDTTSLTSLAQHIDNDLSEMGFPRETRPFTPHLTIARVRPEAASRTRSALGTAIRDSHGVTRIEFEADAVSLMRSQLTPRGAIYTRMAHLSFDASSRTR